MWSVCIIVGGMLHCIHKCCLCHIFELIAVSSLQYPPQDMA